MGEAAQALGGRRNYRFARPATPARRLPAGWPALAVAGPGLLTAAGLAMWMLALGKISLDEMGGIGLIGAVPPLGFAGLALINAGMISGLFQARIRTPLVAAQLIVSIFALHGAADLMASNPVFHVSYRHAGIVEHILRTGEIDPFIDAYFNWPGFFILSGLISETAGLASAVGLIRWAPVFFNLLYLAPLLLLFKAGSRDDRTVWLAAWFFYLANWIGQDYFSPQAATFFSFIFIVALMLRWLTNTAADSPTVEGVLNPPGSAADGVALSSPASAAGGVALSSPGSAAGGDALGRAPRADGVALNSPASRAHGDALSSPASRADGVALGRASRADGVVLNGPGSPAAGDSLAPPGSALGSGSAAQRMTALAAVIAVFAALVPSHQLTPFAICGAVAALVVFRRCAYRTLPVLMGVLIVTWMIYMSVTYLAGHLEALVQAGGTDSAAANVHGRVKGSPEHLVVVYGRLVMSAAVWGLAALGALRRFREGNRDLTFVVLAAAPFPLMLLQSYGGEMLLRIYLFVLPFAAFLVARLFTVRNGGRRWMAGALAGATTMTLLPGFLLTRYGNEVMNQFTSQEIAAVQRLYRIAPRGSMLVAATEALPWKYRDYGEYRYRDMTDFELPPESRPIDELARALRREAEGRRIFLVFTRSTRESAALLGVPYPGPKLSGPPGGWVPRMEARLRNSPLARTVYANRDATIFEVARA